MARHRVCDREEEHIVSVLCCGESSAIWMKPVEPSTREIRQIGSKLTATVGRAVTAAHAASVKKCAIRQMVLVRFR